ncbi:MAG: hypothetical protein LBB59_01985 [Campylobacteraceae bacterium]|jgi:hypothetical protein|nr:hypothetical protein [Campylobacteraceae bacterium]
MRAFGKVISWYFAVLFLALFTVSTAAESASKNEKAPMDQLIEAILKTGGTYTVLLDDTAQEEWANLMMYLEGQDPRTIAQISLPINVQFYGLAQQGKTTPMFSITPKKSGILSVTVDTKGDFTPDIKCGEKAVQENVGFSVYRVNFAVTAGKTYHITIGDSLNESGLYSVTAVLKP